MEVEQEELKEVLREEVEMREEEVILMEEFWEEGVGHVMP